MTDAEQASAQATVVAKDDATVENQIGVVSGDAIFHKHETIYQVSRDDTPEKRFEVARSHLDGGAPRVAEELLAQVLRDGFVTTEVAYYYAIAVLSERPLSHIGPIEFEHFEFAQRSARRSDPDGWTDALGVIATLMSCVFRQETTRDVALADLNDVLNAFTRLDAGRRMEISHHLDMLLDGAVQDRLDRINADAVAQGRIADERQQRAWKFFEPDPAKPIRPKRYFHKHTAPYARSKAVMGALGFLAALWLGSGLGLPGGLTFLWLLLLLACAGSAWWFGSSALADAKRKRRLDFECAPDGGEPIELDELYGYGSRRFRAGLKALVGKHFREPELAEGVARAELKRWHDTMSRVKHTLLVRLIRTYGVRQREREDHGHTGDLAFFMKHAETLQEPDLPPSTLSWLIRWHAKRAARQWRDGTLFAYRAEESTHDAAVMLSALGAAGAVVGLLTTVAMPVPAAIVFVVGAIAAAVGGYGAAELMAARMAEAAEDEDCDALHVEETEAYKETKRELADRPTDTEMASWLGFDKSHLKTTAMRSHGLSNRDIIAHIVLTEGAPTAKRARVLHGPPRYSAYVVRVFLMTEGGIRVVRVNLDFEDGAVRNERQTSFSYDSLSSVDVAEVGVRFAGERRHVVVISEDRIGVTDKVESLVVSKALRLERNSGEVITVVVENFDGILDDRTEDKSSLVQLAEDTSGVAGALRILLAIAAEKQEWIKRERERRNRRWQDWTSTPGGREALSGGRLELLELPRPNEDEPSDEDGR